MKLKTTLLAMLLFCTSFLGAQANSSTQTISVSGNSVTFVNSTGAMVATFEEQFTGTPATVSVVIKGCNRILTACDTLETYTTVTNSNRSPTISKPYAKFVITGSWTGGTNPTIVINYLSTTAALGPGAASGPPSGAAGGDLSGTYPNPGVKNVNGLAIPLSAALVGTNGSNQFAAVTTIPVTAPSAGQVMVGNAGGTAYAPVTVTGCTITSAGAMSCTPTAAGLSAVTNDAQTKAAVVPNTAPSAGQVLLGNAGGTAYAPTTTTGCTITSAGAISCTPAAAGLSAVTNDAQTKAAVVPNTAPSAGQVLLGNAGGTAYAPVSLSQDLSVTSAGVVTISKINNVAIGTAATQNTGTSGATIGFLNGINTHSGALTFSAAGAASTPGVLISGAPFTGGSGTTTFPQVYANSGAAPTTFSTNGTIFSANAPSGFTGILYDGRVNGGGSVFNVGSTGSVTSNVGYQVSSDTFFERAAGGIWRAGKTSGTTTGTIKLSAFQSVGTKFTSNAGCSESATLGGATAGKFTAGATGCTIVVTMGDTDTAANGWACSVWDTTTTADVMKQTAFTTTTATFAGTVAVNDIIIFGCIGF